VELGSLKLESIVKDQAKEQKYIIFDPIPQVEVAEPSDDPLLEFRAAVYLISGWERRSAP
jgi:catalase